MAGIVEYIRQYGKVTMEESPFNEVDNLVMAELSYTVLDEWMLPDKGGARKMKIKDIGPLLHYENREEWDKKPLIYRTAGEVLYEMSLAPRYQNMILRDYVNHVDEDADEQFSAITIQMSRKEIYVAFSGTDDTIVGWKEDFQMSYKTPIPSQVEAAAYLNKIGKRFLGKIYVGGHSKGGNLAVFAAIYASDFVKKHIVKVYNNDGPGFLKKMMDREEYKAMLPKIITFVPQSSVVGRLMAHEEEYTVVQSDQVGFLQHNAVSWQVIGNQFVKLDKTTLGSEIIDHTMKSWLELLSAEDRENLTNALFEILESMNLTGAHELVNLNHAQIKASVQTMHNLDDEQKKMLLKMAGTLLAEGGKTLAKMRQFY